MQKSATTHKSFMDMTRAVLLIWRYRLSLSAWRRRARHRRDLWALYGAEDRILRDVGITREEIRERMKRSDLLP
ncbi:MAG: hypothetical protein AAF922_16500 [Pseudomonadota bacterium]